MELKDKTIVVTGGASGIGREMCRRFHREGARNIVVADLNFEDATSVAEEVNGIAREVDVSAENDIVELIDFTEANLGPIDLFCSNAGIGLGRDIDEPDEVWEKIWHVNTYGERGIKVSVLCPQAVRTAMTAGGAGVAAVDGMIEPDIAVDAVVETIREERFLVLPHPEVAEYIKRKTSDYDRWIAGMQRLQRTFSESQ